MSNLGPNEPPMNQQQFKGITSAKQKQEKQKA